MALRNNVVSSWSDLTEDEQLEAMVTSKSHRTKVYSGQCTLRSTVDDELWDLIDKATAKQLQCLERRDPRLMEKTDRLWAVHCRKEFRGARLRDGETWRQMYFRCLNERDAKLKAITANIKRTQDKTLPVRHTKMVYVDSVVKPVVVSKLKSTIDRKTLPSSKLATLAKAGITDKARVPNPSSRVSSGGKVTKPRKAPLMLKTLKDMKKGGIFRR